MDDALLGAQRGDAGTSDPVTDAASGSDASDDAAVVDDGTCVPAEASDRLPARSSVMQRMRGGSSTGVFTSDLFGLFQSNCGGCHVDNSLGGFQAKLATFSNVVTSEALDRLTSDDPKFFMPPGERPGFSKLGPEDPLVELARLLEAWVAAGKPADVFYPAEETGGDDPNRYLLDKRVGTQLTNLGDCIPPVSMVRGVANEPDALDTMFAKAKKLPERLEQTDLTSLDAEALAKQGVVAFAPAYTLWADDAKKIRHVRVPRGKAIEFIPDKQEFSIPTNTRFYKTFFKRVVDLQGNKAYRKMETRIIVSRPDEVRADGTVVTRSLFGTYAWNDAETEAVLVRDPLRNGKPFRDRIVTYITDEPAAEDVITTGPDDLQAALSAAGVTRTYAIPGSERCIQCHLGAPNGSFVLGFLPLQLLRRPVGQGGVIEPAERDELNQLQRLIDYGVISGMKSPKDVVLLEDSQGERKPRNQYELEAQGYMLGNCAHCHNPYGFPSRIAPELRDALDFMPSHEGGVFQFPLERTSPRIFRGVFQNVPQPYITPSLYDRAQAVDLPDGTEVGDGSSNYAKKEIVFAPTAEGPLANEPLVAPWRSLIYRNVDAPFTYEEDYSIYPRMPMHTPGYDCRVRRVLGSWMVSIPARARPAPDLRGLPMSKILELIPDSQPYVEATPADPDYERLLREAQHRVVLFEGSPRYHDCPDPEQVDTVDPAVVRGDRLVPAGGTTTTMDADGNVLSGYELRVPLRPHYAVTDLTNPPGEWSPRRPDWSTLLVDQDVSGVVDEVLIKRIAALGDVVVTEALREVALTVQPFGLWKAEADCQLGKQAKVGDFEGAQRPRWMRMEQPPSAAAVYSVAPGAEVFAQICQNCHGPEGDSQGRLAATIADMTGGQTRVANLRDGMFGPADAPGDNRLRVFEPYATATVTAEDWAARYLMFMGLGGTRASIPTPALDTIRNGTVLGLKRAGSANLDVSTANMLSVPHALCRAVLPGLPASFMPEHGDLDFSSSATLKSPLIAKNGDYEMWRRLCAVDNAPTPVRVVKPTTSVPIDFEISPTDGLRSRSAYPSDARVGDHEGHVQLGVDDDNLAPWCIARSANPAITAAVEARWQAHAGAGAEPPYCPEALLLNAGPVSNLWSASDIDAWAARGAMNAGMAVFLYLDALAKGTATRVVPYDRCEEL
jgi:mono/diheme cytochrome c family protein